MKPSLLSAFVLAPVVSAIVLNGTACTVNSGQAGLCIATASCTSGSGTFEAGHCPGSDDIKCCTWGSCQSQSGIAGLCLPDNACKGQKASGACPGPDNVQCCFSGLAVTESSSARPSSTVSASSRSSRSTTTAVTTDATISTQKPTSTSSVASSGLLGSATTTRPPLVTAGAAKIAPMALFPGVFVAYLLQTL